MRVLTNDHVRLSGQHPVRAARYCGTHGIESHAHSFCEIAVVTAGAVEHRGRGRVELLEAGTVIVVPQGASHELTAVGGIAEVINVFVLDGYLSAELGVMWRELGVSRMLCGYSIFPAQHPSAVTIRPEGYDFALIAEEARLMVEEGRRLAPSPLLMRSALSKLIVFAGRAAGEMQSPHARDARPEIWALFMEIEAAVEEARAFDTAAVAKRMGLSLDRLSRLFRKHTGLTPSAHFQRRRAHAAGRRLIESSTTVTELAHDLGYSDAAHLSRMFKRVTGLTPKSYRRTAGPPEICD